jgi:hypothetical protein
LHKKVLFDDMIGPLKDLAVYLKEVYQSDNLSHDREQKIDLLAKVMALFIILHFGATIEPYPSQIMALLLLLGIVSPNETLSRRLVQMGPG